MRPILVILGPTATGKSALAMQLAGDCRGEIVNADALQVYRRLEIGTAKPTTEDRQRVPHHLVDILEPDAAFSAGEFARLARRSIEDIRGRSRLPIVVGGSGLYLRALLEGLSPIPQIAGEIRQELGRRLQGEGLDVLRAELRRVDPESERRLAAGDTQRVLRALEVWLATSRTLSSWRRQESPEEALVAVKIGLTLPRMLLYDRIAQRVEAMFNAGWVEEVSALLDGGYSGSEPAFQAIGYRQLVEHVVEGCPLSETMSRIIVATRRYAKRQLTWFRRESGVEWHDAEDCEAMARSLRAELVSVLRPEDW